RDGRRDGRAATVPTVPVYVIDVLSSGTVGTVGRVRSLLFSGNGDCARPLAARRAIKRDFDTALAHRRRRTPQPTSTRPTGWWPFLVLLRSFIASRSQGAQKTG